MTSLRWDVWRISITVEGYVGMELSKARPGTCELYIECNDVEHRVYLSKADLRTICSLRERDGAKLSCGSRIETPRFEKFGDEVDGFVSIDGITVRLSYEKWMELRDLASAMLKGLKGELE